MTQTGKCDICRLRKVKCDEKRPKCSACCKRDRPCTYTYGKPSALVVEDPNQYSGHGRSKAEPLVYPLISYSETDFGCREQFNLHLRMERETEKGGAVFQAFEPISEGKDRSISISSSQKNKNTAKIPDLGCLVQSQFSVIPIQPSCPEATLTARYIHMLGPQNLEVNPLSILGSWISSIPSRIGFSPVLDLAVEYLVNSFTQFWDPSYSKHNAARASKARALKILQHTLDDGTSSVNYDAVLATKLHFAAEVFMGIETLNYTIHAAGVSEMLKVGYATGMDKEQYWNLVDNTYIDDVSEALLAGRVSKYDNDFYLSLEHPLALCSGDGSASPFHLASTLVMHSFIQLPRLACLVRHSILHPEDAKTLASAVCLAESLWVFDPGEIINEVLQTSTSVVATPPSPDISDIIPTSFHFDSIQSLILLTRYWMLRLHLCGILHSLHHHFPIESTTSLLPDLETIQQMDIDAATKIAMSLLYSLTICPSLPLVPLRIYTSLQVSIGPWHRTLQRHSRAQQQSLDPYPSIEAEELIIARRMEEWVAEESNKIHDTWGLARVNATMLGMAVDVMAGEAIPNWLPRGVRLEEVEGEAVIKLEFGESGSFGRLK